MPVISDDIAEIWHVENWSVEARLFYSEIADPGFHFVNESVNVRAQIQVLLSLDSRYGVLSKAFFIVYIALGLNFKWKFEVA